MNGIMGVRSQGVRSLMVLFTLASVSAFGATVKGTITNRTGERLIVKSAKGNVTVVLTENTKTKDDTGLFGLGTTQMGDVVLIPGLKVKIDGTHEHGHFVAKTITVDGDDLETSEMIQSGLHPTAQQVEANVKSISANQENISTNKGDISTNKGNISTNKGNISANKEEIEALRKKMAETSAFREKQIASTIHSVEQNTSRFSALADYNVKAENTVRFATGSSTIQPEYEEGLKQLAATATGLKGYIVEVTGFCDTTGNAAINTKLSEDRAKAVITYLMQQGQVPVRHIVAPGAMGHFAPAATNETREGRAENRRVEVKVLVNKGIAGE